MAATQDPENQGSPSPWASTRTQLATGFVILLVVAGALIAIFHHSGGSSKHPAQASAPQPSAGTTPAQPSTTRTTSTVARSSAPGGCSLPAGSQAQPTNAAPTTGVTWRQVGTMQAPESSSFGPQHVVDGVQTCFAHSPDGALLAAMNVFPEFSTSLPANKVIADLTVGGPSNVTSQPIDSGQGGKSLKGVQIAGYKFNSYSTSNANVDVVLQYPNGLSAIAFTMIWFDGSWRWSYPANGPSSEPLQTSSVEYPYVAWSAF